MAGLQVARGEKGDGRGTEAQYTAVSVPAENDTREVRIMRASRILRSREGVWGSLEEKTTGEAVSL